MKCFKIIYFTALCGLVSYFLLPASAFAQVDTAWVRRYNGPENSSDLATAVAVDGSGNVYVTGYSVGSGTSGDFATIKYNSTGVEQWVARYNGPGNGTDEAYAVAVDGSGNVYVTGYSGGSGTIVDYTTIKYNSTGVEQWVARYNGPGNSSDKAYAIAVDGSGNVYVTGYSVGSDYYDDYATIKYNSAGVQEWIQRYDGPVSSYDEATDIAVDGSGNVYVTGHSVGSGTSGDFATIKYNSTGVEQWVARYNGPGNYYDEAYSIAVDGQGNVYVAGWSFGSGTFSDYATIKYVQTLGIEEERLTLDASCNTLKIFPNPAKTFFAVRLPQTANRSGIKIYDVTGKMVREVKLPMGSLTSLFQRISLDGIKNGIYFIQVDNEMLKEKLVVTK